jgi:hypothetical protein
MFISAESQETTVTMFDQQVAAAKKWFASPRFAGIVRLYHLLFKARWARPESSPVQPPPARAPSAAPKPAQATPPKAYDRARARRDEPGNA